MFILASLFPFAGQSLGVERRGVLLRRESATR
jgi:hypothetical protein